MAIELIKHWKRGSIRAIEVLATADGRGAVVPLRLPAIEATLLALSTAPQSRSTDFDVRLVNAENGLDEFDGCGLRRSGRKPMRDILRFAGVNVHNCIAKVDRVSLTVEGLSPNASVVIKLIYGAGA